MVLISTGSMFETLDSDDIEYFENFTGLELDVSAQNDSEDEEPPMCNFQVLRDGYKPIHGYLGLVVCILGTLFNLMNVLVLSHKDMRGNPINLLLTGIAVADVMVMLEYIPFVVHMNLLDEDSRPVEDKYSWGWGVFLWFHVNFTIIIHNVSIWLTLSLAIWRYIMIKHHVLAVTLCTIPRCKMLLLMGYIVPIILTIPNFLANSIQEQIQPTDTGRNVTIYVLNWSSLAESNNKLFYRLNIWFYSFFLKLVPCLVLTIFTGVLIRALYQAEEHSKRMKNGNTENKKSTSTNTVPDNKVSKRRKHTNRTTRLLIVILILFLLTEFPQGILLMTAVFAEEFFVDCYTPLGEMMDMMALLNCSINFVLFCIMSVQFRTTFRKVIGYQEFMAKHFGNSNQRAELEEIPLNSHKN
ncbi:sex peptide receptor isoform X2 [Eurytemora carolleeae]|uniref:sex peptide receptor isoform X2 n=1 Tax=Eurytemora carolleeae TaxID=1294199 RepID=UPI000C79537D|nr:sex peptide receptor isoform X2 [Eurytemora carolleeae]|eukprot:XP_023346816.1 sex peptide receptor-like isoform X2 [Eurytemora affinis]